MKNLIITLSILLVFTSLGSAEINDVNSALQKQEITDMTPEKVEIILNFRDASIGDILDYLSEKTGLVIVSDTYIDGNITVISKKPLSLDESIALINTILKEKGLAAIRTERTLKLVDIIRAKQMNIPVYHGNDPDKIKAGDDVITHIIPVRYVDATKLAEDLAPLLPDYAEMTANEGSNSLIITDTSANIKKMVQIVQKLDTQMASVTDVRVFHLVYADAEDTADLINEIFEDEDNSSRRAQQNQNPFERMMAFRMGRGGRGGQQQEQQTGGPNVNVTAAADERTNTVVVSGPGDTLEVVAGVIKELDANPTDERSIFVYHLKNAQSDNLKDVLNNLFQELQNLNDQATGNTGRSSRTSTRNTRGGFATLMGGTTTDASDISDEVYIESDPDTNTLIIMTSSKNYEKVKKIIDELDKPVPQVLIKVLIAEVTVTDGLDLGTEFSVLNMRDNTPLFETEFLPNRPDAGLITKVLRGDLDFTLHALEEVGRLNVLSRPYILTSNNQTANITVGQRVPFITDTRTTETGQTINTIEYENIGILLEVTPYINPEGLVIMDVSPEISTITADTVPISEELNAAVFAERSSQSRVAVLDGQTIVIGGLMEDQETESIKKVPLVGDVPLVGNLFKRTIKEKQKTELLIFLTPQVTTDYLETQKISDHERSKSNVLKNVDENEELKEHIENMEATFHNKDD